MPWAQRYRQQWITETLYVFGYINREHIVRKFDITHARASLDLRSFQEANPGIIEYDKSAKCYVVKRKVNRDRVL